MRKVVFAGLAAVASAMMICPLALASGWIVIDPITPHVMPPHIMVPTPGGPGRSTAPPAPSRAALKGRVSFGLHLQQETVKVDINGPVARTYIAQVFSNDTDSNLAGTYLFPLPEDTTFSSFSLQIDGKPVEGEILQATAARAQYEQIVRQMADPGLLEYSDYKTVRARIFPIPPHGTKKLQLEYTQALKAENGLYKYRFPLKADEGSDPANDIKIDVKLASQKGMRTIWSPTHKINSSRDGDHKATVAYEEKNILPDKDFVLYYSVSDKEMSADMMAQKRPDENGYFLLSLAPPVEAKAIEGKDIILVADTSGSMAGEKLEECKKALKYVINSLNPGDRFGLIQFNSDVETFKSQLMEATKENRSAALSFVSDLDATGGTNIGEALKTAANMLGTDASRPGYIVLMTDGEPTVGEKSEDQLIKLADAKRDIRLFDFGVGYDVNTHLLNNLAEGHHGVSQYIEPNENLETELANFYQKIKSPVLTDVKIAYERVDVKDVYPREVKDIFAGTQVLLIGRYKNAADAKVKITGKLDGQTKEFSFPVKFPAEESGHSYLNRLWAMRRIGHLTDVAQSNGGNQEVIDEIVSLSKKYGIITQYTSFLVTDPSTETLGWAHRQPNQALPQQQLQVPQPFVQQGRGTRFDYAPNIYRMDVPNIPARVGTAPAPRVPGIPANMLGLSNSGVALPGSGGYNSTIPKSHGSLDLRLNDREIHGTLRSPGHATAAAVPIASYGYAAADTVPHISAAGTSAALSGRLINPSLVQYLRGKSTGHDAVVAAKSVNALKQSNNIDDKASSGVKSVDDKTFYLLHGFWTDSDYDESKQKFETIEFGSKQYFDLITKDPELRKYFGAGPQVIVVHKGHCYKVVQPAAATS